ncbi:ABC transporter substrate-binding protein [Mycobacterium sp. ACS4331]|uniref:substrate-binding periplasmic protein n=1 Tax=Mycobacterium sp. ACS4331 TaxID=1834121 RepID=UPI000800DF17|nr:ABC transporter substrate-binding protein [Mycobacterium sp. ACS4331]OBF28000.1 glutamine-binding protein [Mycobacterium sp. ACS4331]
MTSPLRLICVNIESPPLFTKATAEADRVGYEVDVAHAIAAEIGREVQWVHLPWSEMIPALNDGAGDAILCGQGITEHRSTLVSFTRPYAVFDEAILVRRGEGITCAADLVGKRVLAIADSTNMALAQTFTGAEVVPFDASGEDVLGELVAALRSGAVDAVVDDEVALQPLTDAEDLAIAFSVPTGNRWALAVAQDKPAVLQTLDEGLAQALANGTIHDAWQRWLPGLRYPFPAPDMGVRS